MIHKLSKKQVNILKQWYIWQLTIGFVTYIGVLVSRALSKQHAPLSSRQLVVIIISFVVMGLAIKIPFEKALEPSQKIRWILRKCNYYFQTIGQALLLPLSFSFVMLLIHQVTHINFFVLAIIFLIYLLFMYIPMTYFVYAKIESLVGRIILLCELIAQGIFAGSQLILEFTKPAQIGHVIQTIDNTQVADVISVLISVAFLMYLWGFKLPNFTFSKKASWIVISFLIVFSVWYVIWNGFGDGGKVSDVLFKYDLTMDKINLKMVLTSLETVMEEWLFRFAILSLLLRALQKHAHQIEWAVIINGVLFGLWHFSNGFSGQAWSATFEQMLSAGAAGMLFAAIYLYTQNLAFPIIFHFLNDFLGLSSSADMTMSAPASLDWITTLGQVIIFILIVVFLITGKRRKAIQETLDYQYTMA